jgi:hypothetical protein
VGRFARTAIAGGAGLLFLGSVYGAGYHNGQNSVEGLPQTPMGCGDSRQLTIGEGGLTSQTVLLKGELSRNVSGDTVTKAGYAALRFTRQAGDRQDTIQARVSNTNEGVPDSLAQLDATTGALVNKAHLGQVAPGLNTASEINLAPGGAGSNLIAVPVTVQNHDGP